MTTKKTNAVAKKEEAALPISVEEFEAFAGQGFEETDKDSYAIPFLRILQTTSPQVDKQSEAYVEGAEAGMFLNTVTNELFGHKLNVIPLHYTRDFVEWKQGRKGFVKSHGNDPSIMERVVEVDDDHNHILDNGNIIQDTRNHFLLQADNPGIGPIILALSSSGIKHSKKWMSLMNALRIPNSTKGAPMFSSVWEIGLIRNQNDDGVWYQIGDKTVTKVNRVGWVDKDQFNVALEARELVNSGDAKADYESTVENKESTTTYEQPSNGYPQGEDVPF